VGTEEVVLGLQKVGGEAGGSVAVVVAEAGAERWDGDAVKGGECDDFTPVLLGSGQQVRTPHTLSPRHVQSQLDPAPSKAIS